jgi:pimeloyl-ACP methyl ester carboxylesterase
MILAMHLKLAAPWAGRTSRRAGGRSGAVVLLLAALLGGCAAAPTAMELTAKAVQFANVDGAPPASDGRAGFRAAFCASLRADGIASKDDSSCERWLWRMPDEPADLEPVAESAVPDTDMTVRASAAVFVVTGAFSECVGEEGRPFIAGVERLREDGIRVETIVVSGRSGTRNNAQQIAQAIERAQLPEEQRILLVGYSKGALDSLRFLVDYPGLARRVEAVVSVAGPIFGTPLAEAVSTAYSSLVARLPYEKCPPGDGEVIHSLEPAAARQWLVDNPLPANVRYYSLVGFTTRDHIARSLVPTWKYLNRTDLLNDGQVLAADALIPGATLLGFANADHWGVAESIENVHPFLAGRPDPEPFPIEQLFASIVRFVSSDAGSAGLLQGKVSQAGPPTDREP